MVTSGYNWVEAATERERETGPMTYFSGAAAKQPDSFLQ